MEGHAQSGSDPVDPKIELDKKCHQPCVKHWDEYQKCTERIAKKGSGTCEPWMMDYWTCVDKCTAPKLFAQLK